MKKSDLKKITNHLGTILLSSGYNRRESLDILEAVGKLVKETRDEHKNKKES